MSTDDLSGKVQPDGSASITAGPLTLSLAPMERASSPLLSLDVSISVTLTLGI
jgi:hypothetical protein